jgi:hypothetical protein
MRKLILGFTIALGLSLIFIFDVNSQDNNPIIVLDLTDVKIPKGIVYKKTTESKNMEAVEYIKYIIFGNTFTKNLSKAIMVGPYLWQSLKDIEEFSSKPTMQVIYNVPMNGKNIKMNGAVIRFEEKTELLIMAFNGLLNDRKNIKIRKINENELKYYWAICSYDLEEPILVIETDLGEKYIFDINDDGTIFFIEEISNFK